MNKILYNRIEEAAFQESSMYDTIQESNAAFNASIKVANSVLQNQWISVDEALPDFQQSVVVTNSEGDYWTAWRLNDNCEDTDDNGFVNYGIGEITHWAEIPIFNK